MGNLNLTLIPVDRNYGLQAARHCVLGRHVHGDYLMAPYPALFMNGSAPIAYPCCDKPSAGGLAPRTLTVLYDYAAGPHGYAHRSRVPSLTLPHKYGEEWEGGRLTVMNNAG
jgi:hypothetical protein